MAQQNKHNEPKYKKETFDSFVKRYNKEIDAINNDPELSKYKNDSVLFFVPPSRLLTPLLEQYNSHGPRDLFKSVDGDKKLLLVNEGIVQNETKLTNEMLRTPGMSYAYAKLHDTYYNARNEIDGVLDENETIKDSIKIEISPSGVFKHGDKD